MRINRLIEKTYAEGPGCRFCIWVQGCPHKCDGCFAVDLQCYDGGYEISVQDVIAQINKVSDCIDGITLLGGEPFEYAGELSEIAEHVQSLNKNVLTFTGYTYEELNRVKDSTLLLKHTDLLIDGRFEKALTDYSRPLAGSSNQKFIYLTDRISAQKMSEYKNRFEVRVAENGTLQFNGMGNIEKLQKILKAKEFI